MLRNPTDREISRIIFFYICLAFIGAVAALPNDESFAKTFARHIIIKESAALRV